MSKKLNDIINFAVSRYFDDNENMWIDAESFNDLLDHARALEEMLRKLEFGGTDQHGDEVCVECRWWGPGDHAPDCALAKLIE